MTNDSFRTEIRYDRINGNPVDHDKGILVLGSCFADNIGNKLADNLFKVCVNPFGVLYNPISVLNTLKRIESGRLYTDEELFFSGELWRSFDHHSFFAHPDKNMSLNKINDSFTNSIKAFRNLGTLILTFGTSFVYSLKESGRVVANCHKMPGCQFDRTLISSREVLELYVPFLEKLFDQKPQLQIILTISPVRHLEENANRNQISKSHLLIAANELTTKFHQVHYFPAYEILLDDLRDYRFYKPDLVHPNDTAVNYIWEHFVKSCVSERSSRFIDDYKQVLLAKKHRIQYPDLENAKKFFLAQFNYLSSLKSTYPEIDLGADISYFHKKRTVN